MDKLNPWRTGSALALTACMLALTHFVQPPAFRIIHCTRSL